MKNLPEESSVSRADQVARTISSDKRGCWWPWGVVALVVVIVAAAVAWSMSSGDEKVSWITVPAETGTMTLTVTATGDLQPKSEVTVGSEISGLIDSVEVEANDRVSRGDVLLRIDTESLDHELALARASLNSMRANQRRAQATLEAAQLEHKRTKRLADKQMASQSDLDQASASLLRARADLEGSKAKVARARAEVSAAETRLEKATIVSPIDGVVLSRAVEGGNTVSSAFQTPELLVLAENLDQMELHVAVDEADVGRVKEGQKATFTVDAWPDRTFDAVVDSVALAPPADQTEVVSYNAILRVDNAKGRLRPGMTATVEITTEVREDVLRVPNAALRFVPPSARHKENKGAMAFLSRGKKDDDSGDDSRLWVLQDGEPTAVDIETGPSNGRYTEINDGDLTRGDRLVIGRRTGDDAETSSDEASPDAPSNDDGQGPSAKHSREANRRDAGRHDTGRRKTGPEDGP